MTWTAPTTALARHARSWLWADLGATIALVALAGPADNPVWLRVMAVALALVVHLSAVAGVVLREKWRGEQGWFWGFALLGLGPFGHLWWFTHDRRSAEPDYSPPIPSLFEQRALIVASAAGSVLVLLGALWWMGLQH